MHVRQSMTSQRGGVELRFNDSDRAFLVILPWQSIRNWLKSAGHIPALIVWKLCENSTQSRLLTYAGMMRSFDTNTSCVHQHVVVWSSQTKLEPARSALDWEWSSDAVAEREWCLIAASVLQLESERAEREKESEWKEKWNEIRSLGNYVISIDQDRRTRVVAVAVIRCAFFHSVQLRVARKLQSSSPHVESTAERKLPVRRHSAMSRRPACPRVQCCASFLSVVVTVFVPAAPAIVCVATFH